MLVVDISILSFVQKGILVTGSWLPGCKRANVLRCVKIGKFLFTPGHSVSSVGAARAVWQIKHVRYRADPERSERDNGRTAIVLNERPGQLAKTSHLFLDYPDAGFSIGFLFQFIIDNVLGSSGHEFRIVEFSHYRLKESPGIL